MLIIIIMIMIHWYQHTWELLKFLTLSILVYDYLTTILGSKLATLQVKFLQSLFVLAAKKEEVEASEKEAKEKHENEWKGRKTVQWYKFNNYFSTHSTQMYIILV